MTHKCSYIDIYSKRFHSYKERIEEEEEEEGGEKVKMKKFLKLPFLTYIFLRNHYVYFLVYGLFSLSTSGLHLLSGPKALNKFMVHDVNNLIEMNLQNQT